MTIAAFYNLKGGVGKTTSCVNLACLAARDGYRVLVWDLDPQGGAGHALGIPDPDADFGGKVKKLLKDTERLDAMVTPTAWDGLDVIPAGFGFRHMDVMLGDGKKAAKRLGGALEHLGSRYDLIFLDCPPSISVLSESLFSLADYVFMPMLPTELSRRAFQQVQEHMEASKYATAEVVAFYNLVDRRKTLHRTNVLRGYAAQPELFCEASIPARTDIERMALEMKPLLEYAPDSDSAAAYGALWREIRRKTAMPAPRS
ncbi:ParA family protein [Salidesulfovibrio brasiliensis]